MVGFEINHPLSFIYFIQQIRFCDILQSHFK